MPRPGPRPYECVRRAWHSDRHQPMRGSIIQQIFRVVHGSHKPATKKNREWQEKLPCVVLKAEEIMYSKANSEAEYMDLETLWDRVSDAINTIIRRDESTETGELLPPCVEAALNLGCVPVRASRSQRHSNPRTYLSSRNQESASVATKNLDGAVNEQQNTTLSFHPPNQSTFERPTPMNLTHSVSESNRHAMQQNKNISSTSGSFLSPYEKFPSPRSNHFISAESSVSVNVGRVYPLYTGTHVQPEPFQSGFQTQTNSNNIIVGRPIFPLITEPAQMGCLQNLFSHRGEENASNRITEAHLRDNQEKAPDLAACDLSLRLGMSSEPCSSTANIGSSSCQDRDRICNLLPPQNKVFSFFPMETANDPFGFSRSGWNFKGESQNVEAAFRKRKAPFNHSMEDGQPEFFNHFPGRMKRPDP
ncbi:hypothetical protein LguiA_031382 [Lonicera macranthoides]